LRSFDLPILIGPSRKSFLKQESEGLTEYATAAAVTASILKGAEIVRVHDVRAMKACVDVADAIKASVEEEPEPVQLRKPLANDRPRSSRPVRPPRA
jgi:dihydropteroate synthase